MRWSGKSLVAAPPSGRALWLRHDGSSIHLLASTCFIPAVLAVPVDDCFEVRILRVDLLRKCLYVRPLCVDNQYDELNVSLSAAATDNTKDSRYSAISGPPSMSFWQNIFDYHLGTVYMIRTEKGYARAVLLKREKAASYSMYCIDLGEVHEISASNVCELLPSLCHMPPLCLCVVLESCCTKKKCEEFAFLKEGATCIVKIRNEFPSDYSQPTKEMYPPAIVSQIYRESENGKYVEITCTMKAFFPVHKQISTVSQTVENIREALPVLVAEARFSGNIGFNVADTSMVAESVSDKKRINVNGANSSLMPLHRYRALVMKSASVPAITRDPVLPFMFQKFSVPLPTCLTARVTERTDCDTYLMRNPEILDYLTRRMVTAKTALTSRLCFDRGICCMARLIRPARANNSPFRPQLFSRVLDFFSYLFSTAFYLLRAIASHYRPVDNTCEVLLVDFGQTIVCSTSDLFELQDQPVEVFEKPMASFRCQVKWFSPFKKISNKGIRLLDENDYNVCLTLKCASDLYWAKVTLSDTDFVLHYKKLRVCEEVNKVFVIFFGTKSTLNMMPIRKLKQQKEELRKEEERLHEQEELLRKDEENFTNESAKRKQELQGTVLKMQLWDLSAKLDATTFDNSSSVKVDDFCPYLKQGDYYGTYVHTTNGYPQQANGYDSTNAANQARRHQRSCYLPLALKSGIATSTNQCNRPYQQINPVRSSMPHVTGAEVSCLNAASDYHFEILKSNRNVNQVQRLFLRILEVLSNKLVITTFYLSKQHFAPEKWRAASARTADNGHSTGRSSSRNNELRSIFRFNSKNKKRSANSQAAISPSKTNSVNLNSSTDVQGDFLGHSMSAASKYTDNLTKFSNQTAQLELELLRKAAGDTASDTSHTSLIKKPIYTSDESADYSQLCVSASSCEEQEMFVPSEPEISLNEDDQLHSFPTYQIYHKLISIVGGSELMVQRVGSDADWPVFFVIPTTALKDISAECFDSLYPTQKLDANGIAVGVLCVAECNGHKRTKVRAVIESFSENLVNVRHIDDGHMEIIPRNQLWSTEDLSPSVRTQPALAVPCILAMSEAQPVKTVNYHANEIPCVGQLMRILFKEQRCSDGIWIVELIKSSAL
ncbi:unnamed protein product [Litomosoides sigmodontis]|uniref:Uncharacterized protein n=1 Tax=Litomosoides sigmodontis TaxID=42156 RepID=A0A3P6TD66_LITSI|nr:unnamed protein product [Litomosoides sigmodontis]